MTLICPRQTSEFDVDKAKFTLVREEISGRVKIFACLTDVVSGKNLRVETECLYVSVGHPLELSASLVNEDPDRLQLLKELLLVEYPRPCACPVGQCYALGTKEGLAAALCNVW